MEKFRNKYRIPSARLQSWDYSANGYYFITICTQNREHFFGEIVNGQMQLSEIGNIVETEWLKTFDMRPDMNLQMGEYVVMPNHFHAIIIIGNNQYNTHRDMQRDDSNHGDINRDDLKRNDAKRDDLNRRDAMHCVSTTTIHNTTTITNTTESNTTESNTTTKPNTTTNPATNKFGPQSKNLASIIRGFKIGVTTNARKINAGFAWQPRFHDHIIRNNESYEKITRYIINNPQKWADDTFNAKPQRNASLPKNR